MKNFAFVVMILCTVELGLLGCGGDDSADEATTSAGCPNVNQIPVDIQIDHPFELRSVQSSWQNQASSVIKLHHVFDFRAYNAAVTVTYFHVLDLGNGQVTEQQLVPSQAENVDVNSSSYATDLTTTLPEGDSTFKVLVDTNYVDNCFEDPEQAFLYNAMRRGGDVTIEILGEEEDGETSDDQQESFLFDVSFIGMVLVRVESGEEASWEETGSYDYGFQKFFLSPGGDVTFLFGLEAEPPKLSLGQVGGALSLDEILQELSLLDKDGNSLALFQEQVEGQRIFLVPTTTNQEGLLVVQLRRAT